MTSRIAYNNPNTEGALSLPYHYELLLDGRRLKPLRRAIQLVAAGKRVLESGAGSGVLSILAARAGAQAVYATEGDPAMARFLRRNVRAAGYESIVRVIEQDTRSLDLCDLGGETVDLVIAEHLSTWQVMEPQTSVMNHINRRLASKDAIRIPEQEFNCVELARSQFRFEEVELRSHYFCFSGIRRPVILSKPTVFQTIDFGSINGLSVNHTIEIEATCTGFVNSLRLTSPLKILEGISFQSSDSLMPPVVVPLKQDLEVRTGEVVQVNIRYRSETNWSRVDCEAWINSRLNDVSRPLLETTRLAFPH
jgi:predicted RNA methylase